MKLQFKEIGKTDKGLVRPKNEDNLGSIDAPNGKVFTVCDGMGGHVAGQVASTIAVESILEYMMQQKYQNVQQAMAEAIQFANSKIFERSDAEPELKGMGTTVTMMVVEDEKIHIAHVGDSRIYIHSNEILYRITKDHSLVQQLVDNGIITDKQAETDSRKNQITKALGIETIVEPTVSELPILPKKDDIFLLCSDGLTDMVDEINVSLTIGDDELSLEQRADQLVEMAKGAGGKDNITIQLIKITDSPHTTSTFVNFSSAELIAAQKEAFQKEEEIDKQNSENKLQDTQSLPQFDKQKILDQKTLNQRNTPDNNIDVNTNFFTKKRILMLGSILLLLVIIAVVFTFKSASAPKYLIITQNNSPKDTIELSSKTDFQTQFAEYCKDFDEGTYSAFITNKNYKKLDKYEIAEQNIIPSDQVKFIGIFTVDGNTMPEQKFKNLDDAKAYIETITKNKKSFNVIVNDMSGNEVFKDEKIKGDLRTNVDDDDDNTGDDVVDDDTTQTQNITPIVDDNDAPPELTFDTNFGNTLKKQKDDDGNLYITNQTDVILCGPYKIIEEPNGDELISVQNSDNLWGYINAAGSVIYDTQFKQKVAFIDEIALVETNLGFKFIKTNGTELNPQLFQNARDFSEGIAAVQQNGKWGFIKKSDGAFLVQPEYDKVKNFAGGMAAVNKTTPGWGFINKDGITVYECQFTSISSNFSATLDEAMVVKNGTGGDVVYKIDKNGANPVRVAQ